MYVNNHDIVYMKRLDTILLVYRDHRIVRIREYDSVCVSSKKSGYPILNVREYGMVVEVCLASNLAANCLPNVSY